MISWRSGSRKADLPVSSCVTDLVSVVGSCVIGRFSLDFGGLADGVCKVIKLGLDWALLSMTRFLGMISYGFVCLGG